MKRYLSVFEMIARSSIYKVLLALVAMVVAQGICFYLSILSPSGLGIEDYIEQSHFSLIFKIAYLLITIILVIPGMDIGSKQSYTLKRLRIKEKRIFWLQSLYNMLAYMLLWGAQLAMLLVSCLVYQKNLPEGINLTNQTMFLAFYRNDFMHTILPLEDTPGWWMLVVICVTTAFTAAEFTKLRREGKFGFEILILIATVLIYLPRPLGYDFVFSIVVIGFTYLVLGTRFLMNKTLGGD